MVKGSRYVQQDGFFIVAFPMPISTELFGSAKCPHAHK